MQQTESIEYSCYYHIYNRGINSCNVFNEEANYIYFLGLYDKYIRQIADTYAWVLMPNHFHLLIQIKEEQQIIKAANTSSDRVPNPVRAGTPSQQFSKLFNSYAQAFNKRYKRHGALFERPFKRKKIADEAYLKELVVYIHNNPVYHGFCANPAEYAWSSYAACLSEKPTKLQRKDILEWFGNRNNFRFVHEEKTGEAFMEKWFEIEPRQGSEPCRGWD